MKGRKKLILNVVFLVLIFSFTFYGLLKEEELSELIKSLELAKIGYLLIGLVFVVIFVCSESVIIHYMMRSLKRETSFGSCVKYSFIGFFFSCITPSASGGQPAQIYYMKKDGIDIPTSSLVLMIVTIGYKLVLVVIGAFLLLFQQKLLHQYMTPISNFFLYLGMVLNVIGIGGLLFFILKPSFVKAMLLWIQKLLIKLHIMKNISGKVMDSMEQYHETAQFFQTHLKVMMRVFYLSVFQRVCLFYVTYLVYRSFGLHGVSAYTIVMLQAVISLSVDMLPLPGGMGASESLYMILFASIFGKTFLLPSMILSRGISYYALLLISAIVTSYAHLTMGRVARKRMKLERSCED